MLDTDKNPIFITGAVETELGEVKDQTELSMLALAARQALHDSGMTLKDVDGIFVNYMGEQGSVQVGSGNSTALRRLV